MVPCRSTHIFAELCMHRATYSSHPVPYVLMIMIAGACNGKLKPNSVTTVAGRSSLHGLPVIKQGTAHHGGAVGRTAAASDQTGQGAVYLDPW